MNRFLTSGAVGLFAVATLGLVVGGCATDIPATSVHEAMTDSKGPTVWLTVPISVDLPSGYSTDDLRPDTTWQPIGQIPEGSVYKPIHWTMKVRTGLDYYECYIVVDRKNHIMEGIYIPMHSAFVSLTPPAPIYFNEK